MNNPDKPHSTRRNVLRTGAATALAAGMVATAGCVGDDDGNDATPTPDEGEDPEALASQYVTAYNDRDMDTIEDTWADTLLFNGAEIPVEGLQAAISAYWESFDPLELTPTHAMAIDANHVVERLEFSGTGTEVPYQGYDIEGETFEVTETAFFRAEDGVLTEYWVDWDELGFWIDLGVIEDPP